jgi:hypothetical protein
MRLSALTAARDTLTACFMVGHDDLFGNLFACFKTGAKLDHRLGLSLLDYVDHFPVLLPGIEGSSCRFFLGFGIILMNGYHF